MSDHGGQNDFWERRPHAALRPFVDRLWVRTVAAGAAPVRVLPDGCIDLIVNVGEPSRSLVVGAMTRALVFEPGQPMRLAGVRFRPGGATPFLRTVAAELTDGTVELADLGLLWLGSVLRNGGAPLEEAVQALERALLERLSASRAPDPTIAYAAASLSTAAPPSIAALARDIGWSRQHLARSFRDHVGLSPKQFARVARLQRAVIHLQGAAAEALADAALALGYFDQAHMSLDFRELAGLAPRAAAERGSIFPIRSLFEAA